MEKNKKYVRKSFLVHQYEKEEAFLSSMAREGWHFKKLHIGIPTKYEFVKGEKIDYVYQLDFVTEEEDTEDYHQLFKDAGWEEVFQWYGVVGKWYYFRRIHSSGKSEKIFTDFESKYHMYEKLVRKFGPFYVLMLILEVNGVLFYASRLEAVRFGSIESITMLIFCCIFTLFTVILGYCLIAIIIEKNKMKTRLDQKL